MRRDASNRATSVNRAISLLYLPWRKFYFRIRARGIVGKYEYTRGPAAKF